MKPMRPLTMVLHHDESEASTETVSRSSTFVLCRTQRRQCVELHAVSRPSHHNHMYFHEHERRENQYMKFRVPCGQRPDDRRNKMTSVRRSNTDDRMQRRRMPTAGARSTGHEMINHGGHATVNPDPAGGEMGRTDNGTKNYAPNGDQHVMEKRTTEGGKVNYELPE
ncbi:hypothetical protein M405DRAFT_179993 [Rhizopogon salebrosus TDB-379]|nr:hypothetical protein M405DRAFT_179993 [Rhizopogon salebrosus TDB-379]